MSDVRPANERRIHHGGLLRCCLATIADTGDLTARGDILVCGQCGTRIKVNDTGAWTWLR